MATTQKRLFTPGPTEIPSEVQIEIAKPMMHHRTKEFEAILDETHQKLKAVFQTQSPVLMLASSGTGGMEASVSNFFSTGEHVLVIEAGKFGQRWAQIAKAYGLKVTSIKYDPGVPADPDELSMQLKAIPDIAGVFMTASETSTATYHPVKKLAEVVRQHSNALTVVDGITAIGIHDVKTDDWGLDVVVGGSQKGFMLPPGLAFVAVSEKAWSRAEKANLPTYYFDLKKAKNSQAKMTTAYTPAVSLIRGCLKSCEIMLQTGLPSWFRRHETMTKAVHAGAKAMKLKLIAEQSPSYCLTAMEIPESIGAGKVKGILDSQHNMIVAGGQDELKGKIIRIAHFGALNYADVTAVMSSLEMTLVSLGANIDSGTASKAVNEVIKTAIEQ